MILAPFLAILAFAEQASPASAQAPSPAAPAVDVPSETAPEAQPWKGTFTEGFAALRAHAEKHELDEALSIADGLLAPNSILRWKLDLAARGGWRAALVDALDPVLDAAGWNGLQAPVRAEIWYAKGVLHALAKKPASAEDDFEKARELAGAGELRLDAIYDLGCLALDLGEEQRARIPEISGKPAQPQATPAPAASAPGAEPKEPDPLDLARAAYQRARERFVERLKSDWIDTDTRANLELVMRRLKELDQIEKKRQEEKQKQDQKDKDKQDKDSKDDKDKQDKSKDDKDKKDQQEKQDQKDKDKQEPPKDPKEQDKKPGEDKKDEQKKPEQPKADEKKDEAKKQDAAKADPKEQQMSKEEMTKILDRLQQLEEQAKKLQEQLKQSRRVRVKKDW